MVHIWVYTPVNALHITENIFKITYLFLQIMNLHTPLVIKRKQGEAQRERERERERGRERESELLLHLDRG